MILVNANFSTDCKNNIVITMFIRLGLVNAMISWFNYVLIYISNTFNNALKYSKYVRNTDVLNK